MLEVHAAQAHVLSTARDAEQGQARWARRRQPALAVGRRRCRHPLGLPVARSGSASVIKGAARSLEGGPVVQGLPAVPHRQEQVHPRLLDFGERRGEEVLP